MARVSSSCAVYQELETGDYLRVDLPPIGSSRMCGVRVAIYRARAATVTGDPKSIEFTHVSQEYLEDKCKRVKTKDMPNPWYAALLT